MKKNKFNKKTLMLTIGLLICFIFLFSWLSLLKIPKATSYLGADINQTLNTTVNITNAQPEVRTVAMDSPIDLEAYGNRTVYCNTTVFDWDNDTLTVNASFYIEGLTDPFSSVDNNNKYDNVTCTRTSPQDREMNYTCTVDMTYYTDNSSQWRCNVTAKDDDNATHTNVSDYAVINPLTAIYVPGVLDFGELAVNDISDDKLANITNAGNRNISIYVEGWGAEKGDGLAMNCSYGSIDSSYERYNHTQSGLSWETELKEVTNESVRIDGFTVFHRFDDSSSSGSTNSTYWKLKIPAFAGGICNGKILFTAEDDGT
ncbi:hypothetical protein GF327_03655 [Candidatus Woesearchaeota archaeon]|nr:hypothetical protein [Candidatus Woesearchaeota archaeon]